MQCAEIGEEIDSASLTVEGMLSLSVEIRIPEGCSYFSGNPNSTTEEFYKTRMRIFFVFLHF